MQATEIARGEWEPLFDRLRRDHTGQPVSIETSCWETCSIYQRARGVPLRELRIERSDQPRETVIALTVGESQENAITHTIARPSHVRLEPAERGPDTLRIESEDGIVTTVLFHIT
jgi:hypothetical protein